jgi:hypothetical protein
MQTTEIIVTIAVSATVTLSALQLKELAQRGADETSRGWEQRVATAEAMGFPWAPDARLELESGKRDQMGILAGLPD